MQPIMESSTRTLNLIFFAVMVGGSILILGSLYLIYDVQIFGQRQNTKTDLMAVSVTFTLIHILLTNVVLVIVKKMRRINVVPEKTTANTKSLVDKILDIPSPALNLIFFAVMVGGSILILGSLYLIYDVQIFGQRQNTKTDLMAVSVTFTIIHILLTNLSLFVFKKMRYAKSLIQREKDELANIDRSKDEFAAMIAHELKNPLVPINSYSRMLLAGKFGELSSTQKEKMKIVISGTESMLVLIQDILDIHKAELGKLQLNLHADDLGEIAKNAIQITQPLAERRGVTIINNVKANVQANVDKHRIEQVLINLIKNAIDFVPKDTGTIKVDLELACGNAVITVSDNGCGIPKTHLDKLFNKFYQVDTSQNRERNGSGLGLAICRSIIELHGGTMGAKSEVGKGTSISFKIPLVAQIPKRSLAGGLL